MFKQFATAAVLAAATGFASAGTVTFDDDAWGTSNGLNNQTFTIDGISLTIEALGPNASYSVDSGNLGVSSDLDSVGTATQIEGGEGLDLTFTFVDFPAISLLQLAFFDAAGDEFTVAIDGNAQVVSSNLPSFNLESFAVSTLLSGDVINISVSGDNAISLDDVTVQAVPTPTAAAAGLSALGALALRRRRNA